MLSEVTAAGRGDERHATSRGHVDRSQAVRLFHLGDRRGRSSPLNTRQSRQAVTKAGTDRCDGSQDDPERAHQQPGRRTENAWSSCKRARLSAWLRRSEWKRQFGSRSGNDQLTTLPPGGIIFVCVMPISWSSW